MEWIQIWVLLAVEQQMKIKKLNSGAVTILLAAAIWALSGQSAFAMRYVEFQIWIDGKLELVASQGDRGDVKSDDVWNYLKILPLRRADKSKYTIQPDADNDDHATLKGKVAIKCYYGGGEATVTDLKLVRDKKDKTKWVIDPAEVDRTLKLRKKVM